MTVLRHAQDEQEVLVRRDGAAGFLSLNRPRAIHALTLGMVDAMTQALLEWRDDPAVQVVVIDHAPAPDGDPKLSRGFCSGGDIALLRGSALNDGGATGRAFFQREYRLNHLIHSYPKPIAAFMDGITMGGGVGISQPAPFRIATENTRFAMPETGIGLFPDVGGGWYLSRLSGRVGQYLALTGARFDGAECLWAGLATHYLASEHLTEAKARLAAGELPARALGAGAAIPPAPRAAQDAERIAQHFASDRLEDILASLTSSTDEWAATLASGLGGKSPLSCKVALRQLHDSLACANFAANMAMEFRIASRLLTMPDFAEGVRALIVDKTNDPRWNPDSAEGVSDAALDAIFAPLPSEDEWTPA